MQTQLKTKVNVLSSLKIMRPNDYKVSKISFWKLAAVDIFLQKGGVIIYFLTKVLQ